MEEIKPLISRNSKIAIWAFIVIFLLGATEDIYGDELVHEFKNPSFSGVGTSSHYLTIENQEFSRRQAIAEKIESALQAAQRDAENTTLAKFMRNLELVESLFESCSAEAIAAGTCTETTFGSFVLEGNTITYQKTICDESLWACSQGEQVIVMTIVAEDGTETQIVIPIGAGSTGG